MKARGSSQRGLFIAPLLLAPLLLALACRSNRAGGSVADGAAPAASSARTTKLTPEEATAEVRALPEVAERLKTDREARIEHEAGSELCARRISRCEYRLSVGRGPKDVTELVFVVDSQTGDILVDADRHHHFQRERPISLAEWRDERKERPSVTRRVAELPEVRALESRLEAQGLSLALWLDKAPPKPGCDAGAADCAWAFYVGEGHPSHSVRLFTVLVDRSSGSISVAGLDGQAIPYERWRKSAVR